MVRVRFAPSPTGYLHIGGARTALFNWLFARHNKGKFILRIEDTDRSRSTEEYIEAIIEGLRWLKLDWDEGPFRQTDRFEIYRNYVEKLMKEGKAYRCYCTPEELEERRQKAISEGRTPKYDGRCRELKEPIPDRLAAIRFVMPQEGQVIIEDMIKGQVVFENSQLDDLIIMRSDGTPTYNFVVVVDDVEMGITHVIRGDDHLNNTPKQVHIYRALGYEIPKFAHLPMILGSDKTRLSKRHGATSVLAYRDMGYLPDALVNYLVRLGWSYGDQEIFTRKELIEYFSFDSVGKSSSIFNPEKLLWINSQYIMRSDERKLSEIVISFLIREGIINRDYSIDMEWLSKAIKSLKERAKTLVELAKMLKYYIAEEIGYEEKARNKFLTQEKLPVLQDIRDSLEGVSDFAAPVLEGVFKEYISRHNMKLGDLAQPVRVALTGGTESPGIFEVLEVMGKEKVLKRLNSAIEYIKSGHII